MKIRTDFISNSSSCCFMVAKSPTHDKSTWFTDVLRPYPDNKKVQMQFDDFTHTQTLTTFNEMWRFVCTQVIFMSIGDVTQGTSKTKKKLMRDLVNSDAFIKLNDAVVERLAELGVECAGIELDEEEIIDHHEDGEDYRILRPECDIDHESIFDSLEDMCEKAHCETVAELIWGMKEIKISWS